MATRPTTLSNGDRAIALINQRQVWLEPDKAFIQNEIAVFGGVLSTVTFTSNKEERVLDNFVFFDGKVDHFFANPSEFARFLDSIKARPLSTYGLLHELAVTGGAPSVIAVIVIVTICFLSINGHMIPDILGNALATILGFYFGSKVTSRNDRATSSSKPER